MAAKEIEIIIREAGEDGGVIVKLSDLISADDGNLLKIGTDGKFLVESE